MKKKREILIGIALILITLVVLGWMSGYYLSPQACVEDSLRRHSLDSNHPCRVGMDERLLSVTPGVRGRFAARAVFQSG